MKTLATLGLASTILALGFGAAVCSSGCSAAGTVVSDVVTIENILKAECTLAMEQPEPSYIIYVCTVIDGGAPAADGGTAAKGTTRTFKVRIPRVPGVSAPASATSLPAPSSSVLIKK